MNNIAQIYAREIINSRATPTVEAVVMLQNGITATASCPTGTIIGKYEAVEIRDNDASHYAGQGVLKAISNITNIIGPKLIGMNPTEQHLIDKTLIELDGTPDKNRLGANAILPVSIAVAKAAAISLNMPLFAYLRHYTSLNTPYKIPTPIFNIINGGKHAGNNLDFQEFLIIPASSMPYSQALNMSITIYKSLRDVLKSKDLSTLIGDEGGFGPTFTTNRDAIVMLNEAISTSSFRLNYDVFLGIDASANNFYDNKKYNIKDRQSGASSSDLVSIYSALNEEFNLLYLEDPLAEDDWEGWESVNKVTSKNTLIVGDDLTSTNIARLQMALSKNVVGAIIIKPNQIGTVIETLAVVEVARHSGLKIIASHRSGDTNDDFIADFSVAIGADYTKFGAPARGERVSKYNRLLEIEAVIKNS